MRGLRCRTKHQRIHRDMKATPTALFTTIDLLWMTSSDFSCWDWKVHLRQTFNKSNQQETIWKAGTTWVKVFYIMDPELFTVSIILSPHVFLYHKTEDRSNKATAGLLSIEVTAICIWMQLTPNKIVLYVAGIRCITCLFTVNPWNLE